MRILWLYRHMDSYNFDHWLHMSFAQYMAAYPGVELRAYGPGITAAYPGLSLLPHHKRHTTEQLHALFPFDVAIVNTKSRCFDRYDPFRGEAVGCWLPSGFSAWTKTPKVVIEEDYHYETCDDWYVETGINLILQRHYSQTLRQAKVPMKFLPFSVDTTVFNPSRSECPHRGKMITLPPHSARVNKFAFVGNNAAGVYKYRRDATSKLYDAGLAVSYAGSKKVDGEYVEVLRKYAGYISCGSTVEICAAKNFEIMASGGVLLTNRFVGIDEIFDPGSYCSFENDVSDVVAQASRVLSDKRLQVDIRGKSRDCIYNRHTHDIRIKELLTILGDLT
jgi:hypothetical protein